MKKEPDVISIHAPPRGATYALGATGTARLFQFTPLREGRRLDVGFNVSRPNISIHAPPRGATTLGALLKTEREKFQFTPLREGRQSRSKNFA